MKVSNNLLTRHQQLTKSAQQMVANTFYGTLLKQMRQSPFRNSTFDGGRGGEAYNQLFDQKIAEKMAGKMHNHIVDAIVKKFDKPVPASAPHGASSSRSTLAQGLRNSPPTPATPKEFGKKIHPLTLKKAYGLGA